MAIRLHEAMKRLTPDRKREVWSRYWEVAHRNQFNVWISQDFRPEKG